MIPRRPHLFIMALFILSFSILAGVSDCRAQETAEITDIAVLTCAGITEIEIKSSAPFTYLIKR